MIEVDLADKIWLVDDWFGYYPILGIITGPLGSTLFEMTKW